MVDHISACRICGNPNLIPIFDLGVQALGSRFPASDEPEPIEAPLTLVKCDDCTDNSRCGLLQLEHNVSGDELYLSHYGYRSGLNQTMISHLTGLVREIESKISLQPGDVIVDIGSNDSTLLQAYTNGSSLRRLGIDPTGTQFKSFYPDDISLVPDFFSRQAFEEFFIPEGKIPYAKVVTTISMFYDLPNPLRFSADIKSILAPDGIWVSEQSYCLTMLERNSFDTICHEHLEYYTWKQFDYIAKAVGLQIIDVSFNECNGGSFRVTLTHAENSLLPINHEALAAIQVKEVDYGLESLSAFVSRCETMKSEFLDFLRSNVDKKIYLYGASTKGNTLLQYYGLTPEQIIAAAERNPEKYGRRTPRTKIPIVSEAEMREQNPDILLVLPWHFKEEFLVREREFLEKGGKIVFPLPQLEIYSKDGLNA